MTPTITDARRAWIGEVSGIRVVRELDCAWAEFSAREHLVATLFGAYDTGKSSILRRLLIDSGRAVPDWLTISARHETYTDQLIDLDDLFIRDTPGLSPEGQDARSLKNSQVARGTLGLTDVLLVVVNPLLATGERPELLDVLSQEWPEQCVWFLISRADEAGEHPVHDSDGFREWSGRKRNELINSLDLDEATPIYVLSADYGQMGAFAADPSPSTWDLSRSWDGMDQLRGDLAKFAGRDLGGSRRAAENRFWRIEVQSRLKTVRAELEDLTTSYEVAVNSLEQVELFLAELDSAVIAAQASLAGAMEDANRRVFLRPQIDSNAIRQIVEPVFETWWQEQQAALARIRQDAIGEFDERRTGRGWAAFESLYSSLYSSLYAPDPEGLADERTFTPEFERLAGKAVEAAKKVDDLRQAHRMVKRPSESAEGARSPVGLGLVADYATALLPMAVELAEVIEDQYRRARDSQRERARRQQVEEEVARVLRGLAERAMKELEPGVEALRQEISDQTIGRHDVNCLRAAVEAGADLVSRGEALLSG